MADDNKESMLHGLDAVSHQEVERILDEVEAWYQAAHEQTGTEWLPIEGITNFLLGDLGYEDMDELEDALNGPFIDFLRQFPNISTKEVDGRDFFQVLNREHKGPTKMTLTVTSSAQLLETTLFKAAGAVLEVPSLEFEIGAAHKRHIDSLYNHFSEARQELEQTASTTEDKVQKEGILKAAEEIRNLLDVDSPVVLVIRDPSGLSEIKPSTGVEISPF